MLKWMVDRHGYPYVMLYSGKKPGKRWYIHTLILMAYVGPRPEGQVARHRDGDPMKPNAQNLSWSTQQENMLDKRLHGTDQNATKTHCANGHPFNKKNTKVRTDRGHLGRECRACNRELKARQRVAP